VHPSIELKAITNPRPSTSITLNELAVSSQQMDIVTYPNPEVIKFIQDHVVPVRLPSYAKPEAADFNVNLKEAYEKLQADYPSSEWAKLL